MRFLSVPAMCVATLLLFSAGGCEEKKGTVVPKQSAPEEHAHVHGPNDGELIELGDEEYHAELLQDVENGVVTIFILDKDAKNAVPIAEEAVLIRMTINSDPTEFKLPAKPLAGEEAGKSSQFQSTDESLRLALGNETAERELEVKIGDKPYKANFEYYEPHDHGPAHEDEYKDEAKDAEPKN